MAATIQAKLGPDASVSLLGKPPAGLGPPAYAEDLHLTEILRSTAAGREEYRLGPYFWWRLADPHAVRGRQEVFRDLERPPVRAAVDAFASGMRRMREERDTSEKLYHPEQKQAWLLQAMETYLACTERLLTQLREAGPFSIALRRTLARLEQALTSPPHQVLRRDAERVRRRLDQVRYQVRVRGNQVRVTRDEGGGDFGEEITRTFARFGGAGDKSHLVELPDPVDMNGVEARIAEGVARLHPEAFGDLAAFAERHANAIDPVVEHFDRELQFFLGYLDLVHRLQRAGLSFSYPAVSDTEKEVRAEATFDLALAMRRVRERGELVTNDLELRGGERVLVVSGPNQGGKTTLARTFGQLHHLAALGCPVPGRRTQVFLCDHLLTHFEREEKAESLRGKLEDDLLRMRAILDQATPQSIVITNELFTSTSLHDARFLSREVLRRLSSLDVICVCVTFLDELSRETPNAVSMVATVDPENPARRTFKVVRRPADGRAYAAAIAAQHGLSYARIRERLGS